VCGAVTVCKPVAQVNFGVNENGDWLEANQFFYNFGPVAGASSFGLLSI
jgi:hypothetical protein